MSSNLPARAFLLVAAILLAACQPAAAPAPLPTLQRITVRYTPALAWLQPHLAACAASRPGIGLELQETPASNLAGQPASLTLRLAGSTEGAGFAVTIGEVELAVVTAAGNSVTELTLAGLQELYALQPGSPEPAYHLYTYLSGDDLRQSIEQALGLQAGRRLIEAPTQKALSEAVAASQNAFGIILASEAGTGLKIITLDGVSPDQLVLPIVATSENEPAGLTRTLLGCLQDRLQQ